MQIIIETILIFAVAPALIGGSIAIINHQRKWKTHHHTRATRRPRAKATPSPHRRRSSKLPLAMLSIYSRSPKSQKIQG